MQAMKSQEDEDNRLNKSASHKEIINDDEKQDDGLELNSGLEFVLDEEIEELSKSECLSMLEMKEKRVLELEKEVNDLNDKYLRAIAESENIRRRAEKDTHRITQKTRRDVFLNILDVLDTFDHALSQETTSKTISEKGSTGGLERIQVQLLKILAREGLKPIETLGKSFNPKLHEAIGLVHYSELEDDVIAEEILKGYTLDDQLLRPSQVRINRLPKSKEKHNEQE